MLRRTTFSAVGKKTQIESAPSGVLYRNRQLGATMHQWHSGMGDPIYAVGSMIYAGKHVEREDAEEAIDALGALVHTAKGTDKKELQGLIRELKKGLGESIEPAFTRTTVTEAGLRKTAVLDEGSYPFKDYVAHLPVQMKKFISSVQSKNNRGMASNASQILFGLAQGFREAGDPDFAKGITRMARVLGREAGHEANYGEAAEAFQGKTYDVKVKPILTKIGSLTRGGDTRALKAALDAAVEAGATPHDIVSSVGGSQEWVKVLHALKKANLI